MFTPATHILPEVLNGFDTTDIIIHTKHIKRGIISFLWDRTQTSKCQEFQSQVAIPLLSNLVTCDTWQYKYFEALHSVLAVFVVGSFREWVTTATKCKNSKSDLNMDSASYNNPQHVNASIQ